LTSKESISDLVPSIDVSSPKCKWQQ